MKPNIVKENQRA